MVQAPAQYQFAEMDVICWRIGCSETYFTASLIRLTFFSRVKRFSLAHETSATGLFEIDAESGVVSLAGSDEVGQTIHHSVTFESVLVAATFMLLMVFSNRRSI